MYVTIKQKGRVREVLGNWPVKDVRAICVSTGERILGDACAKFGVYGIEGITLDAAKIGKFVDDSLMLVTALSPVIGYDKASAIAHYALDHNTTLRDAAQKTGLVSEQDFDRIVNPKSMVGSPHRDLGMTS
jgi:fumarate hydratase class II